MGFAFGQEGSDAELFDSEHVYDNGYVQSWAADVGVARSGSGPVFNAVTYELWGGFGRRTTTPANWSDYDALSLVVKNQEAKAITVGLRVEATTNINDKSRIEQVLIKIPANTTVPVVLDLRPERARAFGMVGLPPLFQTPHRRLFALRTLDLTKIYGWWFYCRETGTNHLSFSDVKLFKRPATYSGVVDMFGQSAHQAWSDKVESVSDMAEQRDAEVEDLRAYPGAGGYEGTTKLPPQRRTGKWYTYKSGSGKWYLVHPSGKVFWAFGMSLVGYDESTPVEGRAGLFQSLPPNSGSTAEFYDTDLDGRSTFDFTSYNLSRKYGSGWKNEFLDRTMTRMKSWGFNTLGPWTDKRLYSRGEMPYCITLTTKDFPTRLQTPFAYWTTLPDPFASNFQSFIASTFARDLAGHNGRASFMGAFVDGEHSWGLMDTSKERYQIAISAINAASTQPSKQEFIKRLKNKYSTIQQLNAAWATSYAAWTSLDQRDVLDPENLTAKCQADLQQFVLAFGQAYFSKVRNALTSAGLTGLYLGSREAWPTTEITQASMPYIDVYSVNLYAEAEKVNWNFSQSTKPVMISEFSYGAVDRGMFHPGLVGAHDQAARALMMKSYLFAALHAQKVVGAIWFHYYDQPTSGRGDGENYNVGFLSTADTPYREMVKAARSIGYSLYTMRGR